MTMLEKIARASFVAWRRRMTEQGRLMDLAHATFDDMSESEQEFAVLHARAVVEAMREPNEVMVAAVAVYWDAHDGGPIRMAFSPKRPYELMIDAILTEKE